MHLVVVFFFLTAFLIQLSLDLLDITEVHQRRRFFAIAMGLFLSSGLVTSAIMRRRKA
jgi:hypothetical protein